MEIDPEMQRELARRAKAVLRKRARALRNTFPPAALAERSGRIVEKLRALPVVQAAGSLSLFWPIEQRNEVDLRALDVALRGEGKRIAYPSIDADTREMVFRWVDAPADMEERGHGFREPAPETPLAEQVAVGFVPPLAVDGRGFRLGYGAGFYDRTLPRYRPPARAVAVIFDFQLAPELPVGPTDVAVDTIVTDTRMLEAEPDPEAEAPPP
ncbi:MAG: 5-formyltetrahydrofolate cyclo-ligase [Polyangiaceae bacterium]